MQSILGRLLLAKVNLAYNRIPWVLLDIHKQAEFEAAAALTLVVAWWGLSRRGCYPHSWPESLQRAPG